MKNLFLLLCISTFSLTYSQSKDLTKKQAYIAFKNSENRIELKLKKTDFKQIFETAECVKKNYNVKFKEMPIFQKKLTDNFIELGRFRLSIYGLGDTIPEEKDKCGLW